MQNWETDNDRRQDYAIGCQVQSLALQQADVHGTASKAHGWEIGKLMYVGA